MKGLSDRDTAIIMILLVGVMIALPYMWYIKDTKLDTENLIAETETLKARYDYLQAMNLHRQEFVARTEELNKERDAIVASYPADILQENYTQFLLETELNHDVTTAVLNEETREVTWDEPSQMLFIDTVSYGTNDEIVITEEDGTETPYSSILNQSSITFKGYYAGMKKLIAYFIDQDACGIPMCYPNFTAEYDEETGVVTGAFIISQFAIRNAEDPDRKLPDVVIRPDLDQYNLRGNLYEYGTNGIDGINGIFGPIVYETEISEEGLKAIQQATGEAAVAEGGAGEGEAAPAEGGEAAPAAQ